MCSICSGSKHYVECNAWVNADRPDIDKNLMFGTRFLIQTERKSYLMLKLSGTKPVTIRWGGRAAMRSPAE